MTPEYSSDLIEGRKYERFIKAYFWIYLGIRLHLFDTYDEQMKYGETQEGFEIKYQRKMKETGNVYIETVAIPNIYTKREVPGALFRNDNSHTWIMGDYKEFWTVQLRTLLRLYEDRVYRIIRCKYGEGYLIPKRDLHKYQTMYRRIRHGSEA